VVGRKGGSKKEERLVEDFNLKGRRGSFIPLVVPTLFFARGRC